MLTDHVTIAAPRLAIVFASLILAGCQNGVERDPLPYSPNYHVVGASNAVRKGYDAQGGRLVPDACVTPDVVADPLYLPPGCANNMNLQLMVERESDLVRGRKTGAAMAAPVVRAARRVIDGTPVNKPAAMEKEVSTTGLQD